MDHWLFTATVAAYPMNLLDIILWKVAGTWLLISARRARAPVLPIMMQPHPRHRSPLPCDGARTPHAAVTQIPMTHLLPLSRSCCPWSQFDESFSILRQGMCVLPHTLNTVSAPFPALCTPKVPILKAHPTLLRFSSISPFLSPTAAHSL